MKPPAEDTAAREPIWDAMQDFWMDTDPEFALADIARTCARSGYSIDELRAIYWNEVRPAVSFNMAMMPAPEWAGFELEWLKRRILKTSRFGKPLPREWLHPYCAGWWQRLAAEVGRRRALATLEIRPRTAGCADAADDATVGGA
ncbi:MAG TPA: hypothetical protein VLK29_10420 [Luteimonas sp.]|nr:hypothetical protein [Luteimonas sp.]